MNNKIKYFCILILMRQLLKIQYQKSYLKAPYKINIFQLEDIITNQNIVFTNKTSDISQQNILCIINSKTNSLHKKHINQINTITDQFKHKFSHIYWVPIIEPVVANLKQQHKILIINSIESLNKDMNLQCFQPFDKSKIFTVHQICSLFPEKVPLSRRKQPTPTLHNQIIKRVKSFSPQIQPTFTDIIISGCPIKMWDEAIQVILDSQQTSIHYIPPNVSSNLRTNLYQLTTHDFLKALETTHKLIKKKQLAERYKIISYSSKDILRYVIEQVTKMHICDTIRVQQSYINSLNSLQLPFKLQTVKI